MDTIHICDLEIFANHGVAEEERILGQKFFLDVRIFLDAEQAGREDDLSLTVNYGEVCRFLDREMKDRNDLLLETVAARLAESLLLHFSLIREVSLEVRKPWAPIRMPVAYASVSVTRGWHKAYLGVGSNLGDREAFLSMAERELCGLPGVRAFRKAPLIETEPVGYTDQPDFLNTVFELETFYSPSRLFKHMRNIEDLAGRTREIHWGPRTLDLDFLLYDDLVTEDPDLILPHPLMHERTFVLEPLCQLNPWGIHPIYRKRFRDLLDEAGHKE